MKPRRFITKKERRLFGPPRDEPWAWLTTALLSSASWRAMSVNTRKLIDFLLIEHRNHAGYENGALMATHNQLAEYGLTPCHISGAINEAEFLGLIRVKRGGRRNLTNQPSTFRLTWITSRDLVPPTNEWKAVTEENISEWKQERRSQRQAHRLRKQNKSPALISMKPLKGGVPEPKTRQAETAQVSNCAGFKG